MFPSAYLYTTDHSLQTWIFLLFSRKLLWRDFCWLSVPKKSTTHFSESFSQYQGIAKRRVEGSLDSRNTGDTVKKNGCAAAAGILFPGNKL